MSKKSDNLSDIWKLKQRGKRDSDRHKELVERAIRKNGKDLITEYNIVKSDGNKKIKVPLKFLDKYHFKYGRLNNEEGLGQGNPGKPGDKFKMGQPEKGDADGPASDNEGKEIYEAEITIDELVSILLEELNLPWMDPKNKTQVEIENEEMNSIERKGIFPNLHIKKTIIENLKRHAKQGNPVVGEFSNDDLRFKSWETETDYHSNAAVYLLMDRSGSMDKEKTHIAKSFFFWMVQFLKKRYKKVDLVFIAHDSRAFEVDEKQFFEIGADGGTQCSSAYKLALEHIKSHHPADDWNNYVFHFSDGDNYGVDNELCLQFVNQLLPLVKAIGYGEIILRENPWMSSESLLSNYFNKNIKRTKFLSMQFRTKEDVFVGLKKFFNVDNVNKKT